MQSLLSSAVPGFNPALIQNDSLRQLGLKTYSNAQKEPTIYTIINYMTNLYHENGNLIFILDSKTGSGKTTCIAPFLFAKYKTTKIYVAEPKINIAISLAKGVLQIYGQSFSTDTIGYRTSERSRPFKSEYGIDYMTSGVAYNLAVNMTGEDPSGFDRSSPPKEILIIDEAHIKNNNHTDLILNNLISKMATGVGLFVVLMSGTIDAQEFVRTFRAQIRYLSPLGARLYPETRFNLAPFEHSYAEVTGAKVLRHEHFIDEDGVNMYETMSNIIYKCKYNTSSEEYNWLNNRHGDVIIFMPSQAAINGCATYFEKHGSDSIGSFTVVKVTSANLRTSEGRTYRITNNAIKVHGETSKNWLLIITTDAISEGITFDNAVLVIQSAMVLNNVYVPPVFDAQLILTNYSKSANGQMAGRVGRNINGISYSLCTKLAYELMMFNPGPALRESLELLILSLSFTSHKQLTDNFYPGRDHICFNTWIVAMPNLKRWSLIDKNNKCTELGRAVLDLTAAKIDIMHALSLILCYWAKLPVSVCILINLLLQDSKFSRRWQKQTRHDSFKEIFIKALNHLRNPRQDYNQKISDSYLDIKNELSKMNLRSDYGNDKIFTNMTSNRSADEQMYKGAKLIFGVMYYNTTIFYDARANIYRTLNNITFNPFIVLPHIGTDNLDPRLLNVQDMSEFKDLSALMPKRIIITGMGTRPNKDGKTVPKIVAAFISDKK